MQLAACTWEVRDHWSLAHKRARIEVKSTRSNYLEENKIDIEESTLRPRCLPTGSWFRGDGSDIKHSGLYIGMKLSKKSDKTP